MTEAIKNIMDRNSCRDYKSNPLSDEQVKTLVEAALAAPSAMNLMPWHLTVITDKSFIEELDSEGMAILKAAEDQSGYERYKARGGKMLYGAPSLFVISAQKDAFWAGIDSGILCQNLAIAAESMGLGSVMIGMLRVPLDGARGAEFKKRMQFPEGYEFAISILVGEVNEGKVPHDLDFNKVSYVK